MVHTPVVQKLINLLWEVGDLDQAVRNALKHEIPELETYGITSAKGFLDFADWLVTEWIPTETAKGKDIYYIICIFYFVLSQEPFGRRQTKIAPQSIGKRLTPISRWVVDFAKQVGAHLDSPGSINEASFNTFRNSPIYHINEAVVPEGGFKTFNQFFARTLKDGVRPIAEPGNDEIIVFPADSSFAGAWEIDENSEVMLKNLPWPVAKLIDGSEHADAFAGGVWMHSFLNTFDYHRQHAPVSGKVIEARVIQGAAYLEVLVKTDEVTGVNFLAPSRTISDQSKLVTKGIDAPDTPGYQFLQTRGLIIIENETLGKVAILPIGMAHVSSVVLTIEEGQEIKKGDEISYFQFGGSDCVMLFEASASVTGFPDSEVRSHFNYGEKLATAHPGSN